MYRHITGAPRYTCTLKGEIGESKMKARKMEGKLKYIKSITDEYTTRTHENSTGHKESKN